MIHSIKDFSIVNEADIDVFLGFPCFVYDLIQPVLAMAGNGMIYDSSAFSKPNFYIWKFSVFKSFNKYILSINDALSLKLGLGVH